MRTLAIAALQTAPVPYDLEATWRRYADQVRATRSLFPHVRLVVVPELLLAAEGTLLGSAPEGWMERIAEPVPGPRTDRVSALARKTGLWLIPGSLFERGEDGRVHNTAVAVSPEGEVVARYRKVFPWQPYEKTAPATSSPSSTRPASAPARSPTPRGSSAGRPAGRHRRGGPRRRPGPGHRRPGT